jgi:hypothetical protein
VLQHQIHFLVAVNQTHLPLPGQVAFSVPQALTLKHLQVEVYSELLQNPLQLKLVQVLFSVKMLDLVQMEFQIPQKHHQTPMDLQTFFQILPKKTNLRSLKKIICLE